MQQRRMSPNLFKSLHIALHSLHRFPLLMFCLPHSSFCLVTTLTPSGEFYELVGKVSLTMLRDMPSTDAGKYKTIRVVVLPFFFGSQLLQEKTLPSHQSIMFFLKSLSLHLDCFYLFLYFSIFVSFGPKSFGHSSNKIFNWSCKQTNLHA